MDLKWLNDLILLGGATQLSLPVKILKSVDPEDEDSETEEKTVA